MRGISCRKFNVLKEIKKGAAGKPTTVDHSTLLFFALRMIPEHIKNPKLKRNAGLVELEKLWRLQDPRTGI